MADQMTKPNATMWPTSDTALTNTTASRPFKTLWLQDSQLEPASCVPEEGTGAYETMAAYGAKPGRQEKIPTEYFKMDAAVRDARIFALKDQLGDRLRSGGRRVFARRHRFLGLRRRLAHLGGADEALVQALVHERPHPLHVLAAPLALDLPGGTELFAMIHDPRPEGIEAQVVEAGDGHHRWCPGGRGRCEDVKGGPVFRGRRVGPGLCLALIRLVQLFRLFVSRIQYM